MKSLVLCLTLICSLFGFSQTQTFEINWKGSTSLSTPNKVVEIPSFNTENHNFSFENGLHIVKKRAELMQNAVPSDEGAMAAILGLKDSEVINICNNLEEKGVIEAVNFNSPGQVVVAGEKIIIDTSLEVFKEAGAKRAIILPVSVPSHCSLMKEAAIEFKEFLSTINLAV